MFFLQKLILTFFCMIGWVSSVGALEVGLVPVPTLKDVQTQAQATFDTSTSLYTYDYTVNNPASNTGDIYIINIDISIETPKSFLSSQGLTIPFGVNLLTFDEVFALERNPVPMVPVGIQVPQGWRGGLWSTGGVLFGSGDPLLWARIWLFHLRFRVDLR